MATHSLLLPALRGGVQVPSGSGLKTFSLVQTLVSLSNEGVRVGLGLGNRSRDIRDVWDSRPGKKKIYEASAYVSLNTCSQTPFLESGTLRREAPSHEQGQL